MVKMGYEGLVLAVLEKTEDDYKDVLKGKLEKSELKDIKKFMKVEKDGYCENVIFEVALFLFPDLEESELDPIQGFVRKRDGKKILPMRKT